MRNTIIRALSDEMFIAYSYISGRFYISEYSKVRRLNGYGKKNTETIYISLDELHTIESSSKDPDDLPISLFRSPIVIGVMVTNRCNLFCKYCISRNAQSYSKKSNFMHYEEKLFAELNSSNVMSVMLSGGEPTLYDGLPRLLDRISNHHYICLLDTNGTLLSTELLKAIKNNDIVPRVSLDAIDPWINDYCRGQTNAVIDGIYSLVQYGITPRINTVLTSENYKSVDVLAKWMVDTGIIKWHIFRLQRMFAPNNLWITDEELDTKIRLLQARFGDKLEIICKYGNEKDKYASFVIDTEGNCFSTNNLMPGISKKEIFGNVEKQSLDEIWHSCPDEYKRRHYKKYVFSLPNNGRC